jgi:hypothetical protein
VRHKLCLFPKLPFRIQHVCPQTGTRIETQTHASYLHSRIHASLLTPWPCLLAISSLL